MKARTADAKARAVKILALSAAVLGLALTPAVAQRGPEHGRGAGHGSVSARPRGNAGWGAFHHDTAPARIAPHRFGSTNLPRPNGWRGDVHRFDVPNWQRGAWQHVVHGGRLGWWWVVGPDWYFFNAPVYPYPDIYTPYDRPFGWWYWCDPYQEYYPYVTTCPVLWESVMPRD